MTSAIALSSSSKEQHQPKEVEENHHEWGDPTNGRVSSGSSSSSCSTSSSSNEELTSTTTLTSKKRSAMDVHVSTSSPSSSILPKLKKFRRTGLVVSVQRTHSPSRIPSPLSSPIRPLQDTHLQCGLQLIKITPTLRGIKEVARHLKQEHDGPLSYLTTTTNTIRKPHALLALPTECTYEVCTLVEWSKGETLNEASSTFRNDRLHQCKWDEAPSSVDTLKQLRHITSLVVLKPLDR